MNENVFGIDWKVKLKAKVREFKEELNDRARYVGGWIRQNPELATFIGTSVVAVTKITVKAIGKHHNLVKEEHVKTHYCYDRSLGHYWALRRELTNREWLEIDSRKKAGERLSDILSEMKVLK